MDDGVKPTVDPRRTGLLLVVAASAMIGMLLVLSRNRIEDSPPPPEIARDPLLVRGRHQFLRRCASCHGLNGKGNGPLAKNLAGPPPGNLSDATWKYGDQPPQVLRVLNNGVSNAAMPGWKGTLSPDEIRAVAAYVYHLANRPVPQTIRDGTARPAGSG